MDILNIFNSKTRKALFRLYFTNPESEYYLRELERILEIPVSMIRNELLSLKEKGIFLCRKKGNLSFFCLNKSYPLYNELKSIVFKTIGIKGLLKQVIDKIEGVKDAFIYGSFAKNEDNAVSDIDLFLIGDINEDKFLKEINHLEKILKREINYILWTGSEFKAKKMGKDPFILDLLENKKIFLAGEENDL